MKNKHCWLRSLIVLLVAVGPATARADRVDRLAKLLRHESYKVRLQAAIGLGKLKNPRGVPPLIQALRDSEYTVRGLAAAALGSIGDSRATAPLRSMLSRESHPFVKSQVKKAISKLRSGGSPANARFYLKVGKIGNKSGKGGRSLADALSGALLKEFRGVAGVTTTSPSPQALRSGKMKGFVLDGAVLRATARPSGGGVEISCTIKVSLSTYPGNSMKAFYSGGAAMQVSSGDYSPATEVSLFREVIVGAAQGARQQIVNSYLRHQ